jgi:hypothetical protein
MVTINHDRWVFVFGSNLAGRHGKGAALTAARFYGATPNQDIGFSGMSYAIPTKDKQLKTLPITLVREFAQDFINFAQSRPDLTFQLTRIGCGLAGFSDSEIASLFFDAPSNVLLPRKWQSLREPDNTFRVIVAGSRAITDYNYVKQQSLLALSKKQQTHTIEIVSGGARGVDTLGERFAAEIGAQLTRFPAAWNTFGKPAGFLRNEVMAWYSDALISFWDGKSPGTKAMIELANREELQVRTY